MQAIGFAGSFAKIVANTNFPVSAASYLLTKLPYSAHMLHAYSMIVMNQGYSLASGAV